MDRQDFAGNAHVGHSERQLDDAVADPQQLPRVDQPEGDVSHPLLRGDLGTVVGVPQGCAPEADVVQLGRGQEAAAVGDDGREAARQC